MLRDEEAEELEAGAEELEDEPAPDSEAGDEEDDDEDAADDEAIAAEDEGDQASLEELLAQRAAARRGGEESEEDPTDTILALASERDPVTADVEPLPGKLAPLKDRQEFACSNCHLVKPRVQLADPERGLCRDCV